MLWAARWADRQQQGSRTPHHLWLSGRADTMLWTSWPTHRRVLLVLGLAIVIVAQPGWAVSATATSAKSGSATTNPSAASSDLPAPSLITSDWDKSGASSSSRSTDVQGVGASTAGDTTAYPPCLPVPGISNFVCTGDIDNCVVVFVSDPSRIFYRFHCEEQVNISVTSEMPFKPFIREFTITMSRTLGSVTKKTFDELDNLEVLRLTDDIIEAFDDNALEDLTWLSLLSLTNTYLPSRHLPNVSGLRYLQELVATNSGITKIAPGTFLNMPSLKRIDLSDNSLTHLDPDAFEGACDLLTLTLNNNRISSIDPYAFAHLDDLDSLFLSGNPFTELPDSLIGFENLRMLELRETPDLKVLPKKLYQLRHLEAASMYYESHCCLFNKPFDEENNDIARNLTAYQVYTQNDCRSYTQTTVPPTVGRNATAATTTAAGPVTTEENLFCQLAPFHPHCQNLGRRRKRRDADGFQPACHDRNSDGDDLTGLRVVLDPVELCRQLEEARSILGEITNKTTWTQVYQALFPPTPSPPPGNVSDVLVGRRLVNCTPVPDAAFTPCDNLMTWVWLRVLVWCVFIFGFVVNLFVFLVIAFSTKRWDTYRELTLHLVIGDLCIALFLGVLAAADLSTKDDYAQQALGWQKSAGCKVAGFMSVVGSQVIMTTLIVITCERFFKITQHRKLKLQYVRLLLYLGWLYAVASAPLPLFGFSDYSTVATCMPFEASSLRSEVFLSLVLSLNVIMCIVIVVLYTKVTVSTYLNSRRFFTHTRNKQFQEHQFRTLKRSAPLVLSTLTCVIPIAVIGLMSVFQQAAQIDNRWSKVVLVIIYPINCLANPILYGFGRKSMFYDHMFDFLHRRLGLCGKKFHHRRSMVFFHSPSNSRRGSIDSTTSSMSALRRGLSMPMAMITPRTAGLPAPFRRSSSDSAIQPHSAAIAALRGGPVPGHGARTPDRDSAYSSSSGNSDRLGRCFPCIASRERRRSTREETDLAEQFAMQFAASMYGGGARPSTDTQLTTVTSRSALHYHSSTGSASSDQEENGDVGHAAPSAGGGHEFGRQLSSPPVERLPVVREYEGYVVDPTVQQIESSL
eukprot:scpid13706/ scgid0270/ Thyrotropin receptor; Thyroid-stimulating hormone receptor